MANVLTASCAEFKVPIHIEAIRPGPVVTTFDAVLGHGIRSQKLVQLEPDLGLRMANSVRVTRANGVPWVSIEVANTERQYVYLRELVQMPTFEHGRLPLALGLSATGAPITRDLVSMPHLLIAGTTGSGKSVAINAMVVGLLYRHTPETLQILMIDMKRVELGPYAGLPHLLQPVVMDADMAVWALEGILGTVKERFRQMEPAGVRSLESYNAIARKRLPYIVVVIDELADLMLSSGFAVAPLLVEIAQTARAAGVHLIVATQRPSVDVVSGLIKTNFPTRLVFRTASKTDSGVVGVPGAEGLLGRGDAMIMQPGLETERLHGALVDEFEIGRVVSVLRARQIKGAI